MELSGHVMNRIDYFIFSSMFVEPIELEVVLRDNEIDHMETLTSLELVTQMNKAFPDRNFGYAHAEWVLNKYGTVDPFREGLGSTAPSGDQKRLIKETFEQYDVDKSGYIDMRELRQAFNSMGVPEMKADRMRKVLEEMAGVKSYEGETKAHQDELDLDQFCAVLTGHRMSGESYFTGAKEVVAEAKKKHKEKQAQRRSRQSTSDMIATPRTPAPVHKGKKKDKGSKEKEKDKGCESPFCDDTEQKAVKSPLEKNK